MTLWAFERLTQATVVSLALTGFDSAICYGHILSLPLKPCYRAMHFSAKRGIAIACRLSVCLSVCNVGEL